MQNDRSRGTGSSLITGQGAQQLLVGASGNEQVGRAVSPREDESSQTNNEPLYRKQQFSSSNPVRAFIKTSRTELLTFDSIRN